MKRNISKILAILMAFALVMSIATVSAFADDEETLPSTKTKFNKHLVVDSTAQIPDVEFGFTIAAGTPVAASTTTVEIMAGPVTETAPSIESAEFTSGMTTTAGTPTDNTDTAHKFATDGVIVDFTNVVFTQPGVYRYVITENASTVSGVTTDPNPRYLDVFVVADANDDLSIQSYALRSAATNIDPTTKVYVTDPGVKSDGFTNTLTTHDLEFSKAITGNQSDKSKQFKFTLALGNVNPGTYTLELSRADVLKEDSNVTASEGVYTITVPEGSNSYTAYFYLANNDTVKIIGLPDGYTYTLTEDPEDYTSTATLTNYTDATSNDTGVNSDVSTGFTNDRSGIIPTGVIITVAPFAIGLLLFGAIILYMVSKRRRAAY